MALFRNYEMSRDHDSLNPDSLTPSPEKPTVPRRILIVCEPGLLAGAIKSLCESDPRVEVVGVAANPEQASEMIEQLQPNVLLVESSHFPLQIAQIPGAAGLEGVTQLITLSESENLVRICRIEARTLTSPAELIQALVE
jgi:DNA-binding NarL/FixJ family response regulator